MNKKQKHTITISNTTQSDFKPNTLEIKKNISFLLDLLCSFPTEISIQFCDELEMTQANLQFRNKNKPTDVLSFMPTHEFNHNAHFLGDILICVPVCKKQATRAKHSLSNELRKMLTHGLVHLKGFDHERSDNAERVMSKLERALKLELEKKFGEPHFEKDIN